MLLTGPGLEAHHETLIPHLSPEIALAPPEMRMPGPQPWPGWRNTAWRQA